MKRLKLYSLFLGSALPWYLAAALLIFTLSLTSASDLPDGRYVLRTKPGLDGNFVAVVKNRGSLTWLVLPEPLPEE